MGVLRLNRQDCITSDWNGSTGSDLSRSEKVGEFGKSDAVQSFQGLGWMCCGLTSVCQFQNLSLAMEAIALISDRDTLARKSPKSNKKKKESQYKSNGKKS